MDYEALGLSLHSLLEYPALQMTKTFRDNCNINIVQQTNCEPLFPDVQVQLKTYFFVPFVRPCMHLNYGVISGSHACRLRVAYTSGCRARQNLPCRASVSSHQFRCNLPTFEALLRKNTWATCFPKDAESLTTYSGMV